MRQPHAKGSGAFGRFEVTKDVSQYTKAAVFQPGKSTPLFLARFSTVAGERGSPDTWRDLRGVSRQVLHQAGQLRHRREQHAGLLHPRSDEVPTTSSVPSSAALTATCATMTCSGTSGRCRRSRPTMVTCLMGDRGIPKSWRQMDGFSSHTYMWVNAKGQKFWVKYHFKTEQGIQTSPTPRRRLTGWPASTATTIPATSMRRSSARTIRVGASRMQIMPFDEADLSLQPVRPDQGLAARGLSADPSRPDDADPQSDRQPHRNRAGGLRCQ